MPNVDGVEIVITEKEGLDSKLPGFSKDPSGKEHIEGVFWDDKATDLAGSNSCRVVSTVQQTSDVLNLVALRRKGGTIGNDLATSRSCPGLSKIDSLSSFTRKSISCLDVSETINASYMKANFSKNRSSLEYDPGAEMSVTKNKPNSLESLSPLEQRRQTRIYELLELEEEYFIEYKRLFVKWKKVHEKLDMKDHKSFQMKCFQQEISEIAKHLQDSIKEASLRKFSFSSSNGMERNQSFYIDSIGSLYFNKVPEILASYQVLVEKNEEEELGKTEQLSYSSLSDELSVILIDILDSLAHYFVRLQIHMKHVLSCTPRQHSDHQPLREIGQVLNKLNKQNASKKCAELEKIRSESCPLPDVKSQSKIKRRYSWDNGTLKKFAQLSRSISFLRNSKRKSSGKKVELSQSSRQKDQFMDETEVNGSFTWHSTPKSQKSNLKDKTRRFKSTNESEAFVQKADSRSKAVSSLSKNEPFLNSSNIRKQKQTTKRKNSNCPLEDSKCVSDLHLKREIDIPESSPTLIRGNLDFYSYSFESTISMERQIKIEQESSMNCSSDEDAQLDKSLNETLYDKHVNSPRVDIGQTSAEKKRTGSNSNENIQERNMKPIKTAFEHQLIEPYDKSRPTAIDCENPVRTDGKGSCVHCTSQGKNRSRNKDILNRFATTTLNIANNCVVPCSEHFQLSTGFRSKNGHTMKGSKIGTKEAKYIIASGKTDSEIANNDDVTSKSIIEKGSKNLSLCATELSCNHILLKNKIVSSKENPKTTRQEEAGHEYEYPGPYSNTFDESPSDALQPYLSQLSLSSLTDHRRCVFAKSEDHKTDSQRFKRNLTICSDFNKTVRSMLEASLSCVELYRNGIKFGNSTFYCRSFSGDNIKGRSESLSKSSDSSNQLSSSSNRSDYSFFPINNENSVRRSVTKLISCDEGDLMSKMISRHGKSTVLNRGSSNLEDSGIFMGFGAAKNHEEISKHSKGHITDYRNNKKVSKEKVNRWANGLDALLLDKTGVKIFQTFLRSEYSEENVLFWLACEGFKSVSASKIVKEALRIYNLYIEANSAREVNLDHETRMKIRDAIKTPDKKMFEQAQKRIKSLMAQDSYPRFLRSTMYQNLII